MIRPGRKLARLACCVMALASAVTAGLAQPEPSFRSTCGDLRDRLRTLEAPEESLVTIQVEGRLTAVESDGALVYLGLCLRPDPRVLCVTYARDGLRIGDLVVVSGNYAQAGPDHVLLDPCLPSPAG